VLSFFSSHAEAATLRINTPKIILELSPGETYSGEIIAENPTEDEVKIRLYLEDWIYKSDGTGEKDFFPAGTQPLSASRWITFSPAEDVMKPFGRTTIRYTINVPKEGISGGHYSVLFIETILGSTENEEGVNVLVAGRIGALFLLETKGLTNRQGEVTSAKIKPGTGNQPLQIVTTFKNTGDIDVLLSGKFLLMDAEGKIYGRGDLQNMYVMPGDEATGTTQWVGRLAKGAYTALITYDLGKGKTQVSENTFSVE
jgi:hypothetical protein